jgi:hypothetical protein
MRVYIWRLEIELIKSLKVLSELKCFWLVGRSGEGPAIGGTPLWERARRHSRERG